MSTDIAISVKNLGKCYEVYNKPHDRLKQLFVRHKKYYHEFWALKDVSFELKKGETLGVIGCNGQGKSTLLQLVCGTLMPTMGEIEVNGRITALLELGAGFNPEFTGRENVYMNGAILGFSKEAIDAKFNEIAAFADIGEFLDQPVKTYSSGMFVRLAFAVQACVEPEILIVDEALSVGDIFFQQKCHEKMHALLKKGTAVIFVSHDMAAIENYSDRVLLLHKGSCVFMGQPNEAVERYYQLEQDRTLEINKKNAPSSPAPLFSSIELSKNEIYYVDPKLGTITNTQSSSNMVWPIESIFSKINESSVVGDQTVAKCTGVALCNSQNVPTNSFAIGEIAHIYFEFEIFKDIDVPVGGMVITDRLNINIHGKSSMHYLLQAPARVLAGEKIRFCQSVALTISPGEYVFQVGLVSMKPEDYASLTKSSNQQSGDKGNMVLRVRQAGRLLVREAEQGIRPPFYGQVDLEGNCSLSIVQVL